MDYKEIIRLLDAGYTRDEILQMSDNSGSDTGADESATSGTDESDASGADESAASGADELNAAISEMKSMFSDFTKEITAMNIMNSQRGIDNENSVEDIIANIISPKRKEEGR